MDRKLYLEMCREVSTIKGGVEDIKEVPDRLKVVYGKYEYYPVAYQLGFRNGAVTHMAILHELKANAVCYAELSRITRKEGTE